MAATAKLPTSHAELQTLIEDCARFAEGSLTEAQVRERHRLSDAVWTALGNNEDFVEKIEEEKLRRVRNGAAKRELAQKHIVKSPDILNDIMLDAAASPKHRIDASKLLDQFADNGPTAPPPSEIFSIVINLGGDEKLRFDKEIRPTPHDANGKIIEHTPEELLAITATNKREEDGNGGQLI